jgi:hypothetical protein
MSLHEISWRIFRWSIQRSTFILLYHHTDDISITKIRDPEGRVLKINHSWSNIYIHLDDSNLQVNLDQFFVKLNFVATLRFG